MEFIIVGENGERGCSSISRVYNLESVLEKEL